MTQVNDHTRRPLRNSSRVLGLLVVASLSAGLPLPLHAAHDNYESEGSYSYIRTLEGSADLISQDGDRDEASIHQPVLPGEQLSVGRSSRVEVLLADGSWLRLDASTEVRFESLARSYSASDRQTHLRMSFGTLQLVVDHEIDRQNIPRIDTPNATIYLQKSGRYLIEVEEATWTQLVVREGFAEVATERGSLVVRDHEQAVVEGDRWPRATIEPASALYALERWGERLEEEARLASHDDVDDSLRYGSSTMHRHGSWIQVSGQRRAWRPYVDDSWQPYREGFWRYTPGGYTWVSQEPWGWVPYHYGTWDHVPGHGWVWFPDRGFAPAWVYWYWGPDYVGWCPTGYYSRYHHGRDHHRYGVYGWAGGDWGAFAHWSFTPSQHFGGHRGQARRTRPSYLRGSDFGSGRLADGVITTDTSGIEPGLVGRPTEVVRVLRTRPGQSGELPNVTDFVARRDLDPDVEQQIFRPKPALARPVEPKPPSGGPAIGSGEEIPRPERRPAVPSVRPRPLPSGPSGDWREGQKPEATRPVIVRRPATYDGREPADNPDRKPAPVLRPADEPLAPERPVRVTPSKPSSPPQVAPARPSSPPQVTPSKPAEPRPVPPPPPSIKPKDEGGGGSRKVGSTRPPRPPA